MRISQLQNVVWAGNVLVFLGMGYVVYQFVQVKQAKAEPAAKWPEAVPQALPQKWPGDFSRFRMSFEPTMHGRVPDPPPKVVEKAPELTLEQDLRGKLKYLGGMEYVFEPHRSVALVRYDGKDLSIVPGEFLEVPGSEPWQFISYRRDPVKLTAILVFRHPALDNHDVVIEQPDTGPGFPALTEPPIFQPQFSGPFGDLVSATRLQRQALAMGDGVWAIPEEEAYWWDTYGEERVLSKVAFREEKDQAGVSHGLRLMTPPIPAGTPLKGDRGLRQNDVIKSINGVPVRSKEDIVLYLRGPGRGLTRYEVLLDRDGKDVRVVYSVARRAAPDRRP